MAITQQQRSAAAAKAAATRRANKAAGITNPSKRGSAKMRGGPAFATPKPTSREHRMIVLAALTDLLAVRQSETGVTQDARDAYAKFQKLLALALGPTANAAMQTEADSALRMAAVTLVKLAF